MIYDIKKHLIEEGILEHVKNNIGKYTLGAGALALAGSGDLGDGVEKMFNHGSDVTGKAYGSAVNHLSHSADHWKDKMDDLVPDQEHDPKAVNHQDVNHQAVNHQAVNHQAVNQAHVATPNHISKQTIDNGMFTDTKHNMSPTYDKYTGKFAGMEDETETSLNLSGRILAGTTGLAGAAGLAAMSPAAKNFRSGRTGGEGSGYFHTSGRNSMTRDLNAAKNKVNNLRSESRVNKVKK